MKNLSSNYELPTIHPEGYPRDDSKVYYPLIKAKDRYIYAMYINQVPEKIYESKTYMEIHVFDYDGKSIVKLEMNEIFMDFEIDEDNMRLYAIIDNEDNPLIEYSLEELKIF